MDVRARNDVLASIDVGIAESRIPSVQRLVLSQSRIDVTRSDHHDGYVCSILADY